MLANTSKLQAEWEKTLGKTGMVFWQKGTCENITANQPLIVLGEEDAQYITIHISAPTQKLTAATATEG